MGGRKEREVREREGCEMISRELNKFEIYFWWVSSNCFQFVAGLVGSRCRNYMRGMGGDGRGRLMTVSSRWAGQTKWRHYSFAYDVLYTGTEDKKQSGIDELLRLFK